MKPISPEEITKAVNKVYPSGTEAYSVNVADKAIAQAQLDSCEKELREIFEEIKKEMPTKHYDNDGFHHIPKDCKLCWWQALKQRRLR